MKSRTLMIAVLVLGVLVLALVLYRNVVPEKVADAVTSRGLEGTLREMGAADAALEREVQERIGVRSLEEKEIDLDNPSEADVLFLKEVFASGTPSARRSAARVLVELQEPGAVGLLVKASGTDEDREFFCAGALEILRLQSREKAAELMIDVLEDKKEPANPDCIPLLEEKLEFVGGRGSDLFPGFLESLRPRVRLYALRRLEPSAVPELKAAVESLLDTRDPVQAALARDWLARAATVE